MNYLITAIGSLSAEAAIASLRSLPDARIIGCNSFPGRWTPASSLVDVFHQIPPAREQTTFIDRVLQICKIEQIDFLLPLTDPEVDSLSTHRDWFAPVGTTLCMPLHAAIRVCRDKWLTFQSFASDSQVVIIPTWDMDRLPDRAMPFPLIAKPRAGRSSEGLIHLQDVADLRHHEAKLQGKGYVLQPLLQGDICVVDIVRQHGTGRCAAMARLERTRTANGAGITVETLHDETSIRTARRIVDMLAINGCVNIEFLIHDGRPMLMDINPRLSAGVAFSKLAGYDMVVNHLRCFTGEPIDPEVPPLRAIYSRRYVEVTMATTGEQVDHP